VVRTWNADGKFLVEVRDNGAGISHDLLSKIFDAFEQGDARMARQFGGLGLGLAIAKVVVEMHGGTIRADSPGPGRGATFTVEFDTLQAASKNVIKDRPAAQTAAAKHAGRILFVEDHPDTARTMKRLLRVAGFEVRMAGSVGEALRIAEAEPVDIVVSDIGLPDGTGYQLMERLRERSIPGIAISGYGMDEDVRRSRQAGFAEHFVKPVNVAQLEVVLRKMMQEIHSPHFTNTPPPPRAPGTHGH
jgi:CheY-like chemotaxis protein